MSRGAWQEICSSLMRYNGRVTANATHEIKNSLAVINEHAGLIKELVEAVEQGRQADLDKLGRLAQRIVGRVEQTDQVVRRLNTLAHLADRDTAVVDAGRAVELVAESFRRLAGFKELTVTIRIPEGSINLDTRPLCLQAALFACLELAAEAARPGGVLEISLDRQTPNAVFGFGGDFPGPPPDPGAVSREALAILEASLTWEAATSRLVMTMPTGNPAGR